MLTRQELKNVTFGAELEYSTDSNIGKWLNGYNTLPPYQSTGEIDLNCNFTSDNSIESNTQGMTQGLEIRVDYGSYHQLLRRVKRIFNLLNKKELKNHYEVNKSTGLHIHIGAKGTPASSLKSIYDGWRNWGERYFLDISPLSRENNTYCKSVAGINFRNWVAGVQDNGDRLEQDRHYLSINPQFVYDSNSTIEIRVFQSTKVFTKFKAYLKLVYLFLQAEGDRLHFDQLLSENPSLLKWVETRKKKFDLLRDKLQGAGEGDN